MTWVGSLEGWGPWGQRTFSAGMSFWGTGILQTGKLRGQLQRRMGVWELKSGWEV